LTRILVEPTLLGVDVLELEGCDRPIAGAGQDREGNEGSIAVLAGIVRTSKARGERAPPSRVRRRQQRLL
jgi:hypothetical protein